MKDEDDLGDFAPWETSNLVHLRMRQFVHYSEFSRDEKDRGQQTWEETGRNPACDIFVENWLKCHSIQSESENP